MKLKVVKEKILFTFFCRFIGAKLNSQNTQIRVFAEALGGNQHDKFSYTLREQDLFITSALSDKVFFHGETVFKY